MSKKIAKVNVTSDFKNWWEADLNSILPMGKVQIINTVVHEGTLYIIYTFDDEDFNKPDQQKQSI